MASGIYNDWAWKPDDKTASALKRGEAKLLDRRRLAKDAIIRLDLDARRRPSTKKEINARDRSVLDIFLYRYRSNTLEGLLKGVKMEWASLLYHMMGDTYVLGRYTSRQRAEKAIKEFRGRVQYDSFLIVSSEEPDIRFMGNAELDGIMLQFGDQRLGMKKEQKLNAALHYISTYDKTRHGADGRLLKAYKPAPVEGWTNVKVETNTTETGSTDASEVAVPTAKVKKKAAAEKKAAKKVAKKKAGKSAAKGKKATKSAKAGGEKKTRTPREGSKGAVIRQLINEGKNAEVGIPIIKKRCTDTDKVNTGYYMWYAYDMKRKQQLTPAGKKMVEANQKRGKSAE